jgi:hypothetical protein
MNVNLSTECYPPRGLSEWMLGQFTNRGGLLYPVLSAVHGDAELDLQIRDFYVNIYYRGTNLMEIAESRSGTHQLRTRFDKKYIQKYADNPWRKPPTVEELGVHEWLDAHEVLGSRRLVDAADAERHVASIPYRKAAMDASKKRRPKREREIQQEIVRLNNLSVDNEYLVCDFEYSFRYWGSDNARQIGRIDLVAAHRPSPGDPQAPVRLALIELKRGANAIDGAAGLQKHVKDLHGLLRCHDLTLIASEMAKLVEQKHLLGLVPSTISGFDIDAPVDYIIAVAGHNARSQRLRDALLGSNGRNESRLLWPEAIDARVAILGEDLMLRRETMTPFEEISSDRCPEAIFSGTKLRDRRPRAGRRLLP